MLDVLPLLEKGALVAQSPTQFESIRDLNEEEREALRVEQTHRWRHPKMLYFTIILNSIAAAIQGWDQTGSNGANLSWPVDFNVSTSVTGRNACGPDVNAGQCEKNTWIVGLVNGIPYLAIAVL